MNFMKDVYCYNVDYTLLSIKCSQAESHVKMFRCSSVSGTDPFPICTVVSGHLDASEGITEYCRCGSFKTYVNTALMATTV